MHFLSGTDGGLADDFDEAAANSYWANAAAG
jgi:hypothetical protein